MLDAGVLLGLQRANIRLGRVELVRRSFLSTHPRDGLWKHVRLTSVPLRRDFTLLRLDTLEVPREVFETQYDYAEVVHRFLLHGHTHHLVNGIATNLRHMLKRALIVA